jgi:predicted RNA-binding Zn ribbon-like protein
MTDLSMPVRVAAQPVCGAVGRGQGRTIGVRARTFSCVNFDAYAQRAVVLVNAPLTALSDLVSIFDDAGWPEAAADERDLAAFRRAQKRLRDVFDHGSSQRDVDAVAALNGLLELYPVQPRISGHDAADWHMHVTGRGASATAEYLSGAIWGLAVWLCEYGSARFGVCADERCGNVYLDTSSNCCRRFCSERCATRSHVAAHRARKRAETLAAV